eukprot:208244_1
MEQKKQETQKHQKLIHILKSNNLHKHLYQVLCDNDIDLDTLQNDIKENDIDDFCDDLNLKGMQNVKFRKLMRILKTSNKTQINLIDDLDLKNFIQKHKLPLNLYETLLHENIKFHELNNTNPDYIDYICDNNGIKIGTKIRFKKLIEELSTKNSQKTATHPMKPSPLKMNVLLIGDKGVGKTSLIRRYIQNRFDIGGIVNENNNCAIKTEQLGDGSVIDIQIYENYTNIDVDFENIKNADTILLCYDKKNENTFQYCIDVKNEIMEHTKANVIILLVACKADKGYNNREIEERKSQNIVDNFKWKTKVNVFSLECSAKTGINVNSIFLLSAERYAHNIDLTKEDTIFNELIDIALDCDHKIKWRPCPLQDPDIRVQYGITGDNDAIYTVRSFIKRPIYVSCDEFYEFLDARKENLICVKRKDATNIEIRCIKIFDSDRCLVYSAYNSSVPKLISARDFCYLQIRKKFENYKNT